MANFHYKGTNVFYTETGTGKPLLLLHGYLETAKVFSKVVPQLAKQYRVITPDIPGHGQSGKLSDIHSMYLLAEVMHALMTHLAAAPYIVAGHSMGGYIALAMGRNYSEKTLGLVLIHSSLHADSDEKKANRLREIKFFMNGQENEIFETAIPKMFAADNVAKYKNEINQIVDAAQFHFPPGVCALLRGMMQRPNCVELWKDWTKPAMMIFGKKDQYISMEAATEMAALNQNAKIVWLSESGHNGFIEEEEKFVEAFTEFNALL